MLSRRAVLASPLLLRVRAFRALQPRDVLAGLLAEEHAAIHLYGLVGPRLPESLRDAARTAYDDHRRHRDALQDLIRKAGGTPEPAKLAYAVPGTLANPRKVAETIEDSLAVRWHNAVRDMPTNDRAFAATTLADETAHLATWRWALRHTVNDAVSAFPGR
jgi:hypothetical protein